MKKHEQFFATALQVSAIFILFIFGYPGCTSNENSKPAAPETNLIVPVTPGATTAEVDLKNNMYKLWEAHAAKTRNMILCIVDELPGKEQALKSLRQNQVDIGDAIKPFYGEEGGKTLTSLLEQHTALAAEVATAAKAGDDTRREEANTRWNVNAKIIAAYFSNANPYWSTADMQEMMNTHLNLTNDVVQQRVKKNYEADLIAYEKVQVEVVKMSDILAEGIVKQYPEKFK